MFVKLLHKKIITEPFLAKKTQFKKKLHRVLSQQYYLYIDILV